MYSRFYIFLRSLLKLMCKVKYLPTKFYHSIFPKGSSTVRTFKGDTRFICCKSCYLGRFDNILTITIFRVGGLLCTSPFNSEKIFFHGIDPLLQRRPHVSIMQGLPKPTRENLSLERFSNTNTVKFFLKVFDIRLLAQVAGPTRKIFPKFVLHCVRFRQIDDVKSSNSRLSMHIGVTTLHPWAHYPVPNLFMSSILFSFSLVHYCSAVGNSQPFL